MGYSELRLALGLPIKEVLAGRGRRVCPLNPWHHSPKAICTSSSVVRRSRTQATLRRGPQVLGGPPGKSSTHCSGQQSGDGAGLGPEGVLLLNGSEQRRDFQAAPSKDATTKFGW